MFACCDESGIHGNARWWAIGAMWLPDDGELPAYESAATALRQQTCCWGEFKWANVDLRFLDAYQGFLRLTLALPKLRFTSLVIDTRLFAPAEMKRYHAEGGRQEAYLKFVRLLIKHRIEVLVERGHREFTLLYDKVAVRGPLARKFHGFLSDDMTRLSASRNVDCRYAHLSPVNSATLHLMQAADLLTGATWAAWEKKTDTSKKKPARAAIRAQIETWAGGSLTDTHFDRTRYHNLWQWRPS